MSVVDVRRRVWAAEGEGVDFLNGGLYPVEYGDVLIKLVERVMRVGMIGLEVGAYTGWTASRVLPIIKRARGHYFYLDWFRGSPTAKVGLWEWPYHDPQRVLLQALKNLEIQGFADCVSVIVGTGLNLAKVIADGSVDYLYIGADHRYSAVKADIEAWLPKVRPGGVLCGHAFTRPIEVGSEEWRKLAGMEEMDYYPEQRTHFGVVRAVNELLPGYETYNSIWWKVIEDA